MFSLHDDQAITADFNNRIPGLEMDIPAGSAIFPDGTKEGTITATKINPQMVPQALPDGGIPPIYVQLEPDGLEFSEPVPVEIALDPAAGYTVGQEFRFASYGADGTYDLIGSGHAERDSLGNLVVKTDPGVGVTRFSGLACFPMLTGMGGASLGLHLVGGPGKVICQDGARRSREGAGRGRLSLLHQPA